MWQCKVYIERRNLWVGLHWTTAERRSSITTKPNGHNVEVVQQWKYYLCLLPSVVIQLTRTTIHTEAIPCPFRAA